MTDDLDRLASALSDRYTIERELGSGGMATVYLAQDLKHERQVAIKVLRPELAAVLGAERFLNEIKLTANLQHPHILPLFDSGEADSLLYYVMPYVTGESLRDKLRREKQLPIDEAVRITAEVASALDHAHRHAVIHRDIKPGNVLLSDGQALVSDFGIALAVTVAGGTRITETGLSLGTPEYMSPEQATGDRELDARSDVYSLGAVLYEMLAGEPPHTGPTVQAVISKVVTEPTVPVRTHRSAVPVNVDAALQKALAKLPADRFGTATQFGDAISDPQSASANVALEFASAGEVATRRRAPVRWIAAVGWAVALLLAAVAFWPSRAGRVPAANSRNFDMMLPDSAPLFFVGEAEFGIGHRSLAIAPDGSSIVYVSGRGGRTFLVAQRLDGTDAFPLPGTEGAYGVRFSPDGEWVSYFVGEQLKKTTLAGGAPLTLASVPSHYGADWSADGRILVPVNEGKDFVWVSSSGGSSPPFSAPVPFFCWPDLLPDGRHVLGRGGNDHALSVMDLETRLVSFITNDGLVTPDSVEESQLIYGHQPQWVPSGHIVYMRWDGILMALPFDATRLRVRGDAAPILNGVRMEAFSGVGHLAFAEDGTLAYAPGISAAMSSLVWVDSEGLVDTLPFEPQVYGGFDLSPDGTRIVAQVFPSVGPNVIREYDLRRAVTMTIPTQGSIVNPWWWPGGTQVVFTEYSPGSSRGTTIRQRLTGRPDRDTLITDGVVTDVSPDGNWLAVTESEQRPGLWLVPTMEGRQPIEVSTSRYVWAPSFSPDGRWLAYCDNESGNWEVYVAALPPTSESRRTMISRGGGAETVWSVDGDVIYRNGQSMMRVAGPRSDQGEFGLPELIYEGPSLDVWYRGHDISPDGERLLLPLGTAVDSVGHIRIVTNWFEQLKQLAPPQ